MQNIKYNILLLLCVLFVFYVFVFRKSNQCVVTENGFGIFGGLVSDTEVNQLRDLVFDTIESEEIELGDIDMKNNRRIDLLLPITEPTTIIMRKLFDSLQYITNQYDENPLLLEHSCFMNFPFSDPQDWHRDVIPDELKGKLFSVGIALEDIDEDMGALEIVPKSHIATNIDLCDRLVGQRNCNEKIHKFCGYINNTIDYKIISCRKGDVIVWDSSVLHRSGANRSKKLRSIFYFSMLCETNQIPNGGTRSIMNKYKDKLTRMKGL